MSAMSDLAIQVAEKVSTETGRDFDEVMVDVLDGKVSAVVDLRQRVIVTTPGQLTAARVSIADAVADVLGKTRSQIRLPRDYCVMRNASGVPLCTWADDQVEHVKHGGQFTVELNADIVRWLKVRAGVQL